MEIREFVKELISYFPISGTEDQIRARLEKYVELLGEQIYSKYGGDFDYEKLLKVIQLKHHKLPSISEIYKLLDYGRVIKERYSGREGEVITRVINGFPYQFTIVPNHWDKVKSISQLDSEILRRTT